jgi:hypothetical protein
MSRFDRFYRTVTPMDLGSGFYPHGATRAFFTCASDVRFGWFRIRGLLTRSFSWLIILNVK